MTLKAITPSVDASAWAKQAAIRCDVASARRPCSFCGARAGLWQSVGEAAGRGLSAQAASDVRACPLCALPQHLERPRIDDEAALAWLPEMSQQAINATVREIHMQLRSCGEDIHAGGALRGGSDAQRRTLHFGRAVLSERIETAADRMGTGSPHELGLALLELSPAAYARRGELLGGLRLLPLGRFYDGDTDVYPDIVDGWLKPGLQSDPMKAVTPSPPGGTAAPTPRPGLRKLFRKG